MPPEHDPERDPKEWLKRARSNLALSTSDTPGVLLEDLCFGAQQATEKALKGLLAQRGAPIPYIHDVGDLLHRLEETGLEVPASIWDAEELTPFAVVTRYPWVESVSRQQHERAVELARAVVEWVEERLGSGDG